MSFPLVRFNCDQDAANHAELNEYFTQRGYGGFGVQETAPETKKEHYHYCLSGIEDQKKYQALKVNIKVKFPGLVRGKYSFSLSDEPERYERYMCKANFEGDTVRVIWRHSLKYTEEYINGLHAAYWSENKTITKKRKEEPMIEYTINEAKRRGIDWRDRHSINMIYLKEMVARNKPINTFAAKSISNLVQAKLCGDDKFLSELADSY